MLKKIPMYLVYVNFMERERDKFYVINVKYKEISWRVREEKRRKKVTSRSTE